MYECSAIGAFMQVPRSQGYRRVCLRRHAGRRSDAAAAHQYRAPHATGTVEDILRDEVGTAGVADQIHLVETQRVNECCEMFDARLVPINDVGGLVRQAKTERIDGVDTKVPRQRRRGLPLAGPSGGSRSGTVHHNDRIAGARLDEMRSSSAQVNEI